MERKRIEIIIVGHKRADRVLTQYGKATSYKSETVGQTFVIPARDFINAWKEKESK